MPQKATADSVKALTATKPQKTKAERAAERLARLSPWKPGQSGNPLGGALPKRRIWDQFRQFMASPSDFSEHGESNRVLLWKATMQSAVMGEPASQATLIDHDLGTEEGRLAMAEHIRKVARDQAELSLAALGNRINAMSDAEKIAFFEMCSTDPAKYLRAAEAELTARDGKGRPALEAQPPSDSGGPVADTETAASPPAVRPDVHRSDANEATPEAGTFDKGSGS
jgi:hypothetical protein